MTLQKSELRIKFQKSSLKKKRIMLKQKAKNVLAHAQIMFKIRYNFIHKSIDLKTNQKVYTKFHRNYFQFDLKNRKYSKQRLKSISILKKN